MMGDEYSSQSVLGFARRSGITIDHIYHTYRDLNDLSAYPLRHLKAPDVTVGQPWPRPEPFTIKKIALTYLQGISYATNSEWALIDDNGVGRCQRLEPPLLKTDHIQDLGRYRKARRLTDRRYTEQPEVIDGSKVNALVQANDNKALADNTYNNNHLKFSPAIPKAARDYVQDLLSAEAKCIAEEELETHGMTQQYMTTPLLSCDYGSPILQQIEGLDALEVTKIQSSNEAQSKIDYKVDDAIPVCYDGEGSLSKQDLGSMLARVSLSPELKTPRVTAIKKKKFGTPLTPPNSVRLHRKLGMTGANSPFQGMSLNSLEKSNLPPSPVTQEKEALQQASKVIHTRITNEKLKPRLIAPKIRLPNLTPVVRWSSQPTLGVSASVEECQTQVQQAWNGQESHEQDPRVLQWAPWAPFHFNPDEFHQRFMVIIPDETEEFLTSFKPIDLTTLMEGFKDIDAEDDCLEPAQLGDLNELTLLVRRRKIELKRKAPPADKEPLSTGQSASIKLEESINDAGFELLTQKKAKFEKKDVKTAHKSLVALEPIPDGSAVSRASTNKTIKKASRPATVSRNLTLIVSSSSTTLKILRKLRKLVPDIQEIERDFAPAETSQVSISRDADIIVSPLTGIIFASLAEVQQQPLPGSKTIPRIRTKILRVAPMYEQLYIFVQIPPGEANLQETFMDFVSFTKIQNRQTMVNITIESFSEDDNLVERIVALAGSQSSEAAFALVEEESPLECKLRKEAGLNAFAAQAVISKTTREKRVGPGDVLHALMQMTDLEIMNDFRDLIGKKAIRKLDDALVRWPDTGPELIAMSMYD